MIRNLGDGIYQIRGRLVVSYLLVESGEAILIDSGFVGHMRLIEQALQDLQLNWKDIKAILLTHGHLDHTLNLAALRKKTKAPIYAHPLETKHIEGTYCYQGLSRCCGFLEWIGGRLLRYHPVLADCKLSDFQQLEYFGGLRVYRLPGHTSGHCGFYSTKHDILFTGDLFATHKFSTHLPWPWLNCHPQDFAYSINKVLELNPSGLLSNHCGKASPSEQMEAFSKRFG